MNLFRNLKVMINDFSSKSIKQVPNGIFGPSLTRSMHWDSHSENRMLQIHSLCFI